MITIEAILHQIINSTIFTCTSWLGTLVWNITDNKATYEHLNCWTLRRPYRSLRRPNHRSSVPIRPPKPVSSAAPRAASPPSRKHNTRTASAADTRLPHSHSRRGRSHSGRLCTVASRRAPLSPVTSLGYISRRETKPLSASGTAASVG